MSTRWRMRPISVPQMNFIRSLEARTGQLVGDVSRWNQGQASDTINELKKLTAAAKPIQESRRVMPDILPRHMLDMLKDGRYALRNDADDAYIFLRISHPKSGRRAGSFKVQTQHSDELRDVLVIDENNNTMYARNSLIKGMKIADILVSLIPEQHKAAVLYGQRLEQCCRCGRKLTDSRSRYYGIGSECETVWPWVLDQVNEDKGEYMVGADR